MIKEIIKEKNNQFDYTKLQTTVLKKNMCVGGKILQKRQKKTNWKKIFTVNETGRGWKTSKKTMMTAVGKRESNTNRVHKGNIANKQARGKWLTLLGI